MSMVLNNGFCEMTENEMMELEGGLGTIAGIAVGVAVGWVADALLMGATGKSGSELLSSFLFGESEGGTSNSHNSRYGGNMASFSGGGRRR